MPFDNALLDGVRGRLNGIMAESDVLADSIAAAVNKLTQGLDQVRELSEWKLDNDQTDAQLTDCEIRYSELLARTTELLNLPTEIQGQLGHARDIVTAQFDGIEETFHELTSRLVDISQDVPSLLQDKLVEMRGVLEELQQDMGEKIDELWREEIINITEQCGDAMQNMISEQLERFTEFAENTNKTLEEALENLRDFAQEDLSDAVREEGRKVVEAALTRLQQEVVDGVMTSQLQVQLTAMMAPILPQLMVVRAVAGTIKRALEILRMGF